MQTFVTIAWYRQFFLPFFFPPSFSFSLFPSLPSPSLLFKTVSQTVIQASLELSAILLPQLLKCWGYRHPHHGFVGYEVTEHAHTWSGFALSGGGLLLQSLSLIRSPQEHSGPIQPAML